jgi:hypothetical protein
VTRAQKAAGVASRRSLIQDAITKRLGSYEGLASAALLTAALLAAATFLTATASLASASLLLALALLALTLLFISIFLWAATALLSAPTLLAALLPSAFRFDGFVRIPFCFHSTFLYLVTEFADWSFRTRRRDLFLLSNRLGMKTYNRDGG